MLKLVSEIHTRQGAVIFSHAFRAQLYLRPTRYRFPPRFRRWMQESADGRDLTTSSKAHGHLVLGLIKPRRGQRMSRADVISWLSGEERHSLRALIPKVPMIFKAQLSLDRFISLF